MLGEILTKYCFCMLHIRKTLIQFMHIGDLYKTIEKVVEKEIAGESIMLEILKQLLSKVGLVNVLKLLVNNLKQ